MSKNYVNTTYQVGTLKGGVYDRAIDKAMQIPKESKTPKDKPKRRK